MSVGDGMATPRELRREFPSVLDRAYTQYKKYRQVGEIMSREVVTINPEATMDEAARIMGEKHIGSLIVVKEGEPVGIVTERDLLSHVLACGRDPKRVKVGGVMSSPLITISPTAQIKEAAQTMIKRKGRLAVFDEGRLVGIITASDLIRSLPEVPETLLKVDDFMTKRVITADEKTPVARIAKIMGDRRIGSVIITSKGKPIGIFTERDLLTTFLARGRPLRIGVGKASSSPLITAPPGTSVHEAASTMASKHIRRLPIAKDGELVGIITARDLVEAYAK
ncbi:MAG: cyclic nucleotide-binding/CBS domain-containing protein [Candidatus Bathyarchaeia archaeon]